MSPRPVSGFSDDDIAEITRILRNRYERILMFVDYETASLDIVCKLEDRQVNRERTDRGCAACSDE
jgi:hypothetical protein